MDGSEMASTACLVYVESSPQFEFWAEQIRRANYLPTSDIDFFENAQQPRLILWPTLYCGAGDDGSTDALQAKIREKTAVLARLSNLSVHQVPLVELSPQSLCPILPNGVELVQPATHTQHETVEQALGLYRGGAPKIGAKAFWPCALFNLDQRGAHLRSRLNEMELVGRARHLVFGPYFHLPPGLWRITVFFRCDDVAAKQWLRLEWGGGGFATYDLTPGNGGGRYEAVIETRLNEPQEVECRVILTASALDGWFAFDGAEVEKIA
jgi:hypothetical protein